MGSYPTNYGVFNKTVGLLLKNRLKTPRLVSYYCPTAGKCQENNPDALIPLKSA